jgi:hypothetical protein
MYENKSSEKKNWIRIKLESLNPSCYRSAFGSRVRVMFKDSGV